jgi:FtsZ-binding cell division protein ZapB
LDESARVAALVEELQNEIEILKAENSALKADKLSLQAENRTLKRKAGDNLDDAVKKAKTVLSKVKK